jgi:FkbM family methyltransferase
MLLPKARQAVMNSLIPAARAYIRFSPSTLGKQWLWSYFHWRNRYYTAKTKHGFKISGRSNDVVQGYIYYFGVWEPNLTNFIVKQLQDPTRTFVDVGANVGYFSLLAAKLLENGLVISVEPFPSTFELLEHNVSLNGCDNVNTINCAVSDRVEDLSMYTSPLNEGATTSNIDVVHMFPERFEFESTKVAARPISDLLGDCDVSAIKLIKIDVEGFEYEVLKGISPILCNLPEDAKVIVEISPEVLTQPRVSEIFNRFDGLGFLPYKIENSYSLAHYLKHRHSSEPNLITDLPESSTDVIFSRVLLS